MLTEKIVTQYYEDGSFNELPQLITGRWGHGCSSYVDVKGNIVSISTISSKTELELLYNICLGSVGDWWILW